MATTRNIFIFMIFSFVVSCNLKEDPAGLLPSAKGKNGEIIIVIDSSEWFGKVGDTLRHVFQAPVQGIPRSEPLFNLNYIEPKNLMSLFKTQKNIIFVTILNDKSPANRKLKTYFTKESLDMIDKDSTLFMFAKKDEFAKGQEILHLFGKTEDDLIRNLITNKEALQNHFLTINAKRIYNVLYNAPPIKGIGNLVKKKFGANIKIPQGYDISMDEKNFLWLRNFTVDIDKNIFISWVDYTSEELFTLDSLISIREKITKPYILYKPEEPDSYMLTETRNFELSRKEVNFNGKYAVKLQGLWYLNKFSMGGPFVSYALVDESKNRLYYIEGFLYSPGFPQRDSMRELNEILKTFKLPS